MNTVELQYNAAVEKRFIPYIGSKYEEGIIDFKGEPQKVLVIGPRHYCDAAKDDRNLLCNLTDFQWNRLIYSETKPVCFPTGLEVGCTEISAEKCLSNAKHLCCPVYKSFPQCPIRTDCKIQDFKPQPAEKKGKDNDFKCGGNRSLRCETLFAIHDFLDTDEIRSKKLGHTYFGSITDCIFRTLSPGSRKFFNADHSLNIKAIWAHAAFMNLIQRYIPYSLFSSEKVNGVEQRPRQEGIMKSNDIAKCIEPGDEKFALKIIEQLNPTMIILTMKCVNDRLKKYLAKEYYIASPKRSNFWIYQKISESDSGDWKDYVDRKLDLQWLGLKSSVLADQIRELTKDTIANHSAILRTQKSRRALRKYLITKLIKQIRNKPSCLSPSVEKLSWVKKVLGQTLDKELPSDNIFNEMFDNWLRH